MNVVNERCCGLASHKKTVVACLLTSRAPGQPQKEVRTCSTMTAELEALRAWLQAADCTHVAMESTGVSWPPVWNILEGHCALLLVNAQQVKAGPGRQTDVKDSEWLAELLRHGLLTSSFVPDRAQRELRELTRSRASLSHERSAEVNRLQKTWEGGNLKLAAVASDVLGRSAREMLTALVAGTTDPAVLAELARGHLRKKLPQLEPALTAQFGAQQRFLVARQLAHLDALDELIAEVSAEIERRTAADAAAIAQLDTIPG
ncbi:MAG: IS110 family transposase, partial [Chloroflexi bacterium]|nr:IS110 family transposase [Chloroflexota bacterium]